MIIPRAIENVVAILSSTVPRSATCDDIHHCRTIANIVLSCASTIFLCTWVSVHPDVPNEPEEPNEAWWKRCFRGNPSLTLRKELPRRRILLMMFALVAPEAMLGWAFTQWIDSCKDLEKTLDKQPTCTWTEMHAMLARMDGFERVSEDGHKSKERELVALPHDIPMPSEARIKDRSKGDYIAKTITLIQTLWFAIQAAARVSQGLDVTELELTTLAHVILNVFVFWSWWNKSLCIQFPIEVHEKKMKGEAGSEEMAEDGKAAGSKVNSGAPGLSFRVRFGAYIGDGLGKGWLSWQKPVFTSVLCVFGGLFGMMHCLAWNSTFPTHTEQTIWRVCSLIVVVFPGLAVIVDYDLDFAMKEGGWDLPNTIYAIGAIPYVVARIGILSLSVGALRDLPYTAFETPSWSKYIPHA